MRLLIVDDDAGLRQSLALLLQEAGDEVAAEADPEQALRRATAEPFEAILCDVRMPKMDGLTFLRRYRADGEALEGAWSWRAGGRRVARGKRLSSGVHRSVREGGVRPPRVPEEVSFRHPDGQTGCGSCRRTVENR